MKIVIIGPPGSGKTSTGKILAGNLGIPFADSDDLIEAKLGLTVAQIFDKSGEAFFRQQEALVIDDLLKKKIFPDDLVLATGAGLPVYLDSFQSLLELGYVVCLSASIQALVSRLSGDSSRPLLSNKQAQCQEDAFLNNKLTRLLDERNPIYAQARYTIETSNLSPAAAAVEIQRVLSMANMLNP